MNDRWEIFKLDVQLARIKVRTIWLRLKIAWLAARESWASTAIERVLDE